MLGDHTAETSEHLLDGLMEFLLTGVSVQNLGKDGLQLLIDMNPDFAFSSLERVERS
jgi:hypothetical protein